MNLIPKIKLVPYNRVRNSLRKFAAENRAIGEARIEKWARWFTGLLKRTPYPPKRPLQRYVRTGLLGRSWKALPDGVSNPVSYAWWVVNRDTQAWMHDGRWWTLQGKFDENRQRLVDDLTRDYEEAWRKLMPS